MEKNVKIIKLSPFLKASEQIFKKEELEKLDEFLVAFPERGDVIPGTGGARKLRFAARGKGARGGARIIYYYYVRKNNIYLMSAYAKNTKIDLKPSEKKALKKVIGQLTKGDNDG